MKRATVSARPCPVCGKPAMEAFKPFCSARCQDVDLHRWLKGAYAIPGRPAEEEGDEAEGAPSLSRTERDRG